MQIDLITIKYIMITKHMENSNQCSQQNSKQLKRKKHQLPAACKVLVQKM